MKRTFLMFALGLLSVTTLFSCRDKEEKVIVREVEVEKKEPAIEEKKGVFERTAEKVDQEVNKEIDEEIEKIGDDN